MTYTAEDLKLAYQQGYTHGANGQPPLEGSDVVRVVGLLKPEPVVCPHGNHAEDCTVCNPEGA